MIIDEEPYPGPLSPEPLDLDAVFKQFQGLAAAGSSVVDEVNKSLTQQFAGISKALSSLSIHTTVPSPPLPNPNTQSFTWEPSRKPPPPPLVNASMGEDGTITVHNHQTSQYGTIAGRTFRRMSEDDRKTQFTHVQAQAFAKIMNVSMEDAESILQQTGVVVQPPMPTEPPKGQPSKGPRDKRAYDKRGRKKF